MTVLELDAEQVAECVWYALRHGGRVPPEMIGRLRLEWRGGEQLRAVLTADEPELPPNVIPIGRTRRARRGRR